MKSFIISKNKLHDKSGPVITGISFFLGKYLKNLFVCLLIFGYMGLSYGTWALLPGGMWDLPQPGIKSVSPALAGGFLTTGAARKPSKSLLELSGWTSGW